MHVNSCSIPSLALSSVSEGRNISHGSGCLQPLWSGAEQGSGLWASTDKLTILAVASCSERLPRGSVEQLQRTAWNW